MTGIRIDDLDRYSRNRMTHGARLVTDLRFWGVDHVGKVYGDDRCQLGAAIAFQ